MSPPDSGGLSPVDSSEFQWTESSGFQWIESGGFRWIESSGFRWTLQDSCPVEILLDSAGLVQRKNMTEFRGLRPNIPDSARQKMPIWPLSHQESPGDKSAGFHRIPAESSRTRGAVCSPPPGERNFLKWGGETWRDIN